MKRFAAILFMICGQALGQSGVYNVPYKPQPRILIPHVEAPAVLVDTNGTITANPYRNLKYCDFVLKCVSQNLNLYAFTEYGVTTPALYVYSSAQGIDQPFADTNAYVFYQNTALSWPKNAQRKPVKTLEIESISTNLINVAWDDYLSETNYPPSVSITTYSNGTLEVFSSGFTNNRPMYVAEENIKLWFDEDYDCWKSQRGYKTPQTTYLQPTFYHLYVGPSSEQWAYYSVITNITTNYTVNSGPVQVVSSNGACAIEVYPDISKFRSWMKQGNKDVKWMCLLSNGIDFYRDPQSGDAVWFNVEVEWVDRVPEEGAWSN